MEGGLGLVGGEGGSSGGSTNGSVSTLTKAEMVEQDYCMGLSSEVSSNQSDQNEAEQLELGLGLSLGGSGCLKSKTCSWREHGRILTAKDLGFITSSSSSSSSGRGSNNNNNNNNNGGSASNVTGTKRTADSVTQEIPPTNGVSQVVGWPPVRTYRMNSLMNQVKVQPEGENIKKMVETSTEENVKEKRRNSMLVKVNMDGVAIGRKVDLNAHTCYKTLAQALEEMFHRPTTSNPARSSRDQEHGVEETKSSKLLDGSTEFVLTYEDKEGDWMLVGDVPWGMFLNTVKRLRIMRTSEMNGLAPQLESNIERVKKKPI